MAAKRHRAHAPVIALLALLAAGLPARAGSILVRWDPVGDPSLGNYQLYYGTTSRSYGAPVNVGTASEFLLDGLADCQTYYVSLKSIDDQGEESGFSQELSGFTQPQLSGVASGAIFIGVTQEITLTGTSFQSGATLEFSHPAISVVSTTVESCGQLQATIHVDGSVVPGTVTVRVINPGNVPTTASETLDVQVDNPPAEVFNLIRTDIQPAS